MKSLTKLRLINWHYFSNTTTDIKNITFLTGPNGTGKSTIIDALQIILLGTTRPDNFNKAANDKGRSGRSLLSYLRGQTGVDDNGNVINLRTGSFTSYIACEFYDDVEKRTFTLGVMFDVDSADAIDKHYFYLDSPFPENSFSNSDTETDKKKVRPMVYRELSTFVRNNYNVNHFRLFDSDNDYQLFTKEAFGNLPDKYFALFKKAVSFTPISDISTFITEYICDADVTVDIAPMQKNIEQYKILEIQAKELKAKVETLTAIQNSFDEVSRYQKSIELLKYVNARVTFDENKKKLDVLKDKLKADNDRLLAINDSIGQFDKQVEDLRSDLSSYEAKRLQSSNYSLTEKISMKKDALSKSITAITMSVNQVMGKIVSYASDYQKICGDFALFYSRFDSNRLGEKIGKDFAALLELSQDVAVSAKEILSEVDSNTLDFANVTSFRNDMDALRNQAVSLKAELNSELYSVSSSLQSLQSDLSAVNNGKKPFDKLGPDYMAIKTSLEASLRARHSDAKVDIYCDLVDVNDPEWTMALEAVLYNQKFNFFVNPAYYEEADRLLKELTDSYHYYRVSLVDTERLLRANIVANDDSIAQLIDTKDEGARAYTDYVLGRIKKCSSFSEARNSGSGLLSDCTGYRGFATWYLNKANARVYFLGTQVSSDTKAVSASDYQEMNRKYSLLTEALNKIALLLSLPVMSSEELGTYQADIGRVKDVKALEDQVSGLDQEMKAASQGDMSVVNDKIAALNSALSAIEKKREDLLTERGTLLGETSRLNGVEIPTASGMLDKCKADLDLISPDKVNSEYEPFYNKLSDEQHLSLSQIRQTSTQEFIQSQNKLAYSRSNLIKLRNDYCAQYHLTYDVYNETKNDEFAAELEKISKVLLPDYETKIVSAHEASIREFKDDFIYKLRTAIETVTTQIDDLNQALLDSRFGRDSYQFKVTPNKDYLEYYTMIMDPLLLKAGDAESLFMEKYKSTMEALFGLISSSANTTGEQREQVLKNIQTFTDYTTYITFDLLVTRGIGPESTTISLGRSFKSQSGGETQTPFYIAILASFASLTRANNPKDNNTLRLVIFDEAFSKMDSARIMKSTDLLRQFGLQAILSTPSEKLRDLVSYVDLILVTIHDEKLKKSGIDVYQEKHKADEKGLPTPPVSAI
jgi:uncharacterized protein YPO0396